MKNTKIQWCHHTFNPWWGCVKVSEGCNFCYAEAFSRRLGKKLWGKNSERLFFGEKHWSEPLKWNAEAAQAGGRRRVFCASMADVFECHPALDKERERLWKLIEATPHLDWLLLTKRPENILTRVPARENIWLGTSVENQAAADKRIWELLRCRNLASVLFLSMEPLLSEVALQNVRHDGHVNIDCLHGSQFSGSFQNSNAAKVDWVIVGGESGPGARDCNIQWIADTVRDCVAARVPVFVKQLGSSAICDNANLFDFPDETELVGQGEGFAACRIKMRHPKGGDPAEWPKKLRARQFPFIMNYE